MTSLKVNQSHPYFKERVQGFEVVLSSDYKSVLCMHCVCSDQLVLPLVLGWMYFLITSKSRDQRLVSIRMQINPFYYKITFIDRGDNFGTNLLLIIDTSIDYDIFIFDKKYV